MTHKNRERERETSAHKKTKYKSQAKICRIIKILLKWFCRAEHKAEQNIYFTMH